MMSLPDFSDMVSLYREWNEKVNLVSRKDIDNLYEHHILHSLCIAFYLESCRPDEFALWRSGPLKVLDVGCGGGFPGMPLAALFPSVRFTLCDSIGKKIKVASAVASSLGLDNVECVNCRMEELDGHWDYVVSRAVASLDVLLPWVRGRYGRSLICLKGGDLSAELDACAKKMRDAMPVVDVWKISNVLEDEYYAEKSVVNLVNCQK